MSKPLLIWQERWIEMAIESLSNEELLNEYASEVSCEDRRISSDPPSRATDLGAEILKRMGTGK